MLSCKLSSVRCFGNALCVVPVEEMMNGRIVTDFCFHSLSSSTASGMYF